MAAVVHLLGRGIQPRGGALTEEGAATAAAATRLLEAALDAGGQSAGGAFCAAGGFAALRTALACGQLSGRHATEVCLPLSPIVLQREQSPNPAFADMPRFRLICACLAAMPRACPSERGQIETDC